MVPTTPPTCIGHEDNPVDKFFRLALVVVATARLIRFVTEDSLGQWWVVQPVRRWAWKPEAVARRDALARWQAAHEATTTYTLSDGSTTTDPETAFEDAYAEEGAALTWQAKVASGIDCRWCVGFWIGVLVLVGEVTLGRIPGVRHLWTFALAALALNSVANGVGKGIHTLS